MANWIAAALLIIIIIIIIYFIAIYKIHSKNIQCIGILLVHRLNIKIHHKSKQKHIKVTV